MNTHPPLRNSFKRLATLVFLGLGGATFVMMMISRTSHSQQAPSQQPNEKVQQAMVEAINDEYKARALYTAVIDKFGAVRPFSNILQAEERHVQRWQQLFNQYELPLPEDTFADNIEAPDTLKEACENGVEAEIADAQMYDRFLEFVEEPDLRETFIQLRNVSRNNHQRAFERCANRLANTSTSTPCQGQGRRGQGHGQGHGQGRRGRNL